MLAGIAEAGGVVAGSKNSNGREKRVAETAEVGVARILVEKRIASGFK